MERWPWGSVPSLSTGLRDRARRFVPGFGTLQTRKVASVQTILNGRSLPGSKHARVAGFWLQTPAAEPFHHKVNPDPPLLPGEPRVGRDPQDQGNAAADAGAAAAGTWMPCTMYTFSASLSVTDAMLPSRRLRHRPASLPRRPRPPRRACVISLSRGRSCSRHRRRCRELDGLLLRAAPCLAESREPRRLVAGSHRCSPRPGPGSGTARGGDGGCGGSLSRGLGLGKCLRLHGQLGGRTGVDWKSWGEARGGRGRAGRLIVREARDAVCSELELK